MNPKTLNALAARVARLETLLENNDVFKQGGDTTYGGLEFEGSQYNFNDPQLFELQQRINDLELQVANGSRDVAQGGAQDAGASVGDDGSTGSGGAGGIPEGFTQIQITICDNGTQKTMTVIGTVPA